LWVLFGELVSLLMYGGCAVKGGFLQVWEFLGEGGAVAVSGGVMVELRAGIGQGWAWL
jgi:hypothetical protein